LLGIVDRPRLEAFKKRLTKQQAPLRRCDATPPRQPLQLPPNFRDVMAEHVGTVIGIVGAPKPPKDKPK
jgi:hypothetical protein